MVNAKSILRKYKEKEAKKIEEGWNLTDPASKLNYTLWKNMKKGNNSPETIKKNIELYTKLDFFGYLNKFEMKRKGDILDLYIEPKKEYKKIIDYILTRERPNDWNERDNQEFIKLGILLLPEKRLF